MIGPVMAARSPARFLAPLALLGFVLALALIVTHSTGGSGSSSNTTQEQPFATPTPTGGKSAKAKKSKAPRFYVVKSGDTPSSIAVKTGVPLSQIEQLNPSLDPQALSLGERIRLRK
jgi:LysM repeat protein